MSEEIKIEKGIPIPDETRGLKTKYPLRDMDVGNSILLPDSKAAIAVYSLAKRLGMKVVARKQPDGRVRVWRVA